MEFFLLLFVIGYVVFKLASLASAPGEPREPKPKKEPKPIKPKPVRIPSRAEQAAAVKARYEATVRMVDASAMDEIERDSAKQKAKQDYLRELDGLM